jgi:hypothetical protein
MIYTRFGAVVTIIGPIEALGYVKVQLEETLQEQSFHLSDLRRNNDKAEIIQAAAKFPPKAKRRYQ